MSQLDLFAGARVEAPEAPAAHAPKLEPAPATPLEPSEALEHIRAHIADPSRWCQGCSARDADGRPTLPVLGVQWSAYGALALLTDTGRVSAAANRKLWPALDRATRESRPMPFARWHDQSAVSHADVLSALERAKEYLT
jgi:hypothetical protein